MHFADGYVLLFLMEPRIAPRGEADAAWATGFPTIAPVDEYRPFSMIGRMRF